MIDLNLLDQTFARIRRIAEQNQETAEFHMQLFHDQYELPQEEGKNRKLIPGDQEFQISIIIPPGYLPEGAVKVPRVDVAKRMEDARAGQFDREEEE